MLTQARLLEMLEYDPSTGCLTWLERKDASPQWNARWAGKRAGTIGKNGYRYIRVGGLGNFLAHRLIWLMVYGHTPKEVDHQDHDRDNNRLENLRSVDRVENSKNHSLGSNNTSGHVGVHWFKRLGLWTAYIKAEDKRVSLGYFRNLDDAVAARKAADNDYGYHRNHGAAA